MLDTGHRYIAVFDCEGKLRNPSSICQHKSELFVVDSDRDRRCIFVFDRDGAQLRKLELQTPAEGSSQTVPMGCVVRHGLVFITWCNHSEVHVLTLLGEFQDKFDISASFSFAAPFALTYPSVLACDTIGNLLVPVRESDVILVFRSDDTDIGCTNTGKSPLGIAADHEGRVSGQHQVHVFAI